MPRSPTSQNFRTPTGKTFPEDEQRALIDAARRGVCELDDTLTEPAGDHCASELADIQGRLEAVNNVLQQS